MNLHQILLSLCLLTLQNVFSQENYRFDFLIGDAYCIDSPLGIRQSGYDNINITAKYKTNSFREPIYYSYRFSKWSERSAWELELIHLKIELVNRPATVQRFEISHGYNLLILNRIFKKNKFNLRLGGGIVVAHPENTIRNKSLEKGKGLFNAGYFITGPVLQLGIEKELITFKKLSLVVEGKFTSAYSRVPISGGHAHVPLFTLHALAGIRYAF
jgi:hypothetical protein